jgi:outer membrane murein-binding lipoprotein Lpp
VSELEDEIGRLREKTEQNRRQFVAAEPQTCLIAIDRARLEISRGDFSFAETELAIASEGARVIERFSRDTDEPSGAVRSKLAQLKNSLEAVRAELDAAKGT